MTAMFAINQHVYVFEGFENICKGYVTDLIFKAKSNRRFYEVNESLFHEDQVFSSKEKLIEFVELELIRFENDERTHFEAELNEQLRGFKERIEKIKKEA